MRRAAMTLMMLLTTVAVGAAHPVLDRIAADRSAGLLTAAEASLHEMQYVFAGDQLPERYRVAEAPPLPCATPVLLRAAAQRARMNAAQLKALDALMPHAPAGKSTQVLISPSGRFRLTYETSGDARVPTADVSPPNGVPDYVEACAAYMDTSWRSLVETHGFAAERHAGDYYEVTFETMDGALGYTTGVVGPRGATRIAILNSMEGLSWTQQMPDVTPDDIARMVCCHEYKHASQAATSNWSEGDWVELDATWSQDIVFDAENDYRRYLGGDSVGPSCLSHPHIPLDDRDEVSGLYEEMLWQIWMSETWGVEFVREIWDRRREFGAEPMLTTYDVMLQSRGSSLAEGFATFTGWNFLCGSRSASNLGYADAADYPVVPLASTVARYPTTRDGSVDHLASEHHFVAGLPAQGWLHLSFDGQADRLLRPVVAVNHRDGTASLHPVPLDAANDADFVVPVPLDEVDRMGIVIANPSLAQDGTLYTFTASVTTPPPLAVAESSVALELQAGAVGSAPLTLAVPADARQLVWSAQAVSGGEPAAWLSLTPQGGTVAPGGTAVITVDAVTSGLDLGAYAADIVLTYASDDPLADAGLEFRLRIPVEMVVTSSGSGLAITAVGPNPTRGDVTLAWAGAKAGATVEIAVVDLRGRTVRRASVNVLAVGATSWTWDGRDADGRPSPSGRYLLRVSSPTGQAASSVVMVR